jgi:hypothetical protein
MAKAQAISLATMVRAVEKVKERLLRAANALESANVPYAIVGGNAIAAWVTTVDESAVRNTRDVDVLIRRDGLDRASAAPPALTSSSMESKPAQGTRFTSSLRESSSRREKRSQTPTSPTLTTRDSSASSRWKR